jgi:hypothetical protein
MARFRLIPFGLLVGGALAFATVPSVAASGEGSVGWEHPDDHDGHDSGDHDWDHDGDHDGDGHGGYDHDAPPPDGASNVRQKLAEKFDVPEKVITRLRESGMGYGEIDHALTLADRLPGGIRRENVREIVEMRESGMGWGQIAHELDTTMGAARRDFGTSPPPSDIPGVQPTSVTRSGKSSHAAARGSSSRGLGAKSVSRSGSKGPAKMSESNARGIAATKMGGASSARANGRAFAGGSSHGGGGARASAKSSGGKAKGRK